MNASHGFIRFFSHQGVKTIRNRRITYLMTMLQVYVDVYFPLRKTTEHRKSDEPVLTSVALWLSVYEDVWFH